MNIQMTQNRKLEEADDRERDIAHKLAKGRNVLEGTGFSADRWIKTDGWIKRSLDVNSENHK